jgi:hypothetical protein
MKIRRRIDDRSYLKEIQSEVTRHGMGGLKKMVKDSEEVPKELEIIREET